MGNSCSSTLSVAGFADTEKFINAVKNGFDLDGKTHEHPFVDGSAEDSFDPQDGKYSSAVSGVTNWAIQTEYIIALSKHLDTPVGCTNNEEGMDVLSAEVASGSKVLAKDITRDDYLKKHNLQDSEDLYAEDNYYDYQDDIDKALDDALEGLFTEIHR